MENNELCIEILKDMRAILNDNAKSLSERLDEWEWRSEFLNELS